ncbi:DUF6226 family protein [Demequina salsinemoris]|uniref:DUF6226 family protein n=1 Tax=Demequina salsinemoris TaxID=577470 RepID=UPI00128B8B80|nr:DUF6226 family protein [Demequina salsinemoris]
MYTRPVVVFPELRDDAGAVIPYGRRLGEIPGWPPDDAYSVVVHPERFEVAWTIARAIVDHLVATYDVDVIEDADPEAGRLPGVRHLEPRGPIADAPPAVRRIVPRGQGAPLTVIETDHPGVELLAGVTTGALAPVCGCEACDESVEEVADSLEDFAFAVASGEVWERVEGRGVRSGHTGPVSSGSGWSRSESWGQRREIASLMKQATPFAPWPLRVDEVSR